ncbi:MAG TPA: hypothetical protein VFC30_07685, partial [Solirubrobacteraceae bacterium]|nr:hypothetical protein [Solirubrobacteraceae bacterium]
MGHYSRILLAVATAVVLAFALVVILDRPSTRSPVGATGTGTGTSIAENASSSGFDGALLPGDIRAPGF